MDLGLHRAQILAAYAIGSPADVSEDSRRIRRHATGRARRRSRLATRARRDRGCRSSILCDRARARSARPPRADRRTSGRRAEAEEQISVAAREQLAGSAGGEPPLQARASPAAVAAAARAGRGSPRTSDADVIVLGSTHREAARARCCPEASASESSTTRLARADGRPERARRPVGRRTSDQRRSGSATTARTESTQRPRRRSLRWRTTSEPRWTEITVEEATGETRPSCSRRARRSSICSSSGLAATAPSTRSCSAASRREVMRSAACPAAGGRPVPPSSAGSARSPGRAARRRPRAASAARPWR